jgi:hypothetical protein
MGMTDGTEIEERIVNRDEGDARVTFGDIPRFQAAQSTSAASLWNVYEYKHPAIFTSLL